MKLPLLSLSALLTLAACGDSHGEGLARDATLNSLDESELRKLCDELNSRTQSDDRYLEVQCTTSGIVLGSDPTSCTAEREACLMDPPVFCNQDEFGTQMKLGPECDALTVGTYVECMEAIRADSVEAYRGITCETSAEELESRANDRLENFEELVATLCPDVLEQCPTFPEE